MKNPSFPLIGILCFSWVVCLASPTIAQPPGGRDDNGPRRGPPPPRYELGQVLPPPLMRDLDLTSDQRQELDAISKELKAKLEKLLTADQLQRIESGSQRGPGDGGGPEGRRSPQPDAKPAEQSSSPTATSKTAQGKLKQLPNGVTRAPVTFAGGHDTDPRDRGRPVILIASALGVTSEVFRDAFSRVKPAGPGKEPEEAQVRQNKAVLMEALGKHGITDERLNEVSNQYRYPPGRGGMWSHRDAVVNALVKDGAVIGYEIVDGGAGYTSTPTASVPKIKGATADVELSYGKDFETNGSIASISISKGK